MGLGNLSIRSKLLYAYSIAFILILLLGNLALFSFIRSTLEDDIEQELSNTTASILNMVQTAAKASIRNHLRAVAEKNLDIVRFYYRKYKEGKLSEDEAKKKAAEVMFSQTIGKTGYIYVIDSNGVVEVHPRLPKGERLAGNSFIVEQMRRREGYIEYDWANPGENKAKPKALYSVYFGPWDWLIAATSYREEFKELFRIEDFRSGIQSVVFGSTGYPYVMDSKGTLIIHPKLEGTNIYNSRDSSGRMFIKEICDRKNGKIIYPWQNPGEPAPREKLVIFNYIPELDWIVASSSYLEEFYHPLRTIGYSTAIMVLVVLMLVFPLSWWISGSITRPLKRLISDFAKGADGDFSGRLPQEEGGEFGQLATYYNSFMARLEDSRSQLKESEEKYRSIFENAVEGFFQTSPEGGFMTANPSLALMMGYESPENLIASVKDIRRQLYVHPEKRDELVLILEERDVAYDFEAQLQRRDGTIIWVSINARAKRDDAGSMWQIEGFITDITKRRAAEDALRAGKEELEERVRERTAELSGWVNELEQRNTESALLREFGDMIQVCRSLTDTYPVMEKFLGRFFPGDTVELYLANGEESGLFRVVPDAGELPILIQEDSCWALRQDKPYLMGPGDDPLNCTHIPPGNESGYACVPLMAQGVRIGLLHVSFGEHDSVLHSGQKLALASNVADHLSLSLANLKLQERLLHQSISDPLTGLYNRRYMGEVLAREYARARRYEQSFGVVMIDVDHFKKFNDTHGHEAGDEILRELGSLLKRNVRAEDVPCRYGGEEFMLILGNVSRDDALRRAEEIRKAVDESLVVVRHGESLRVTVSLGVAIWPEFGPSPENTIRAADDALYCAKAAGRNCVIMADNDTCDE